MVKKQKLDPFNDEFPPTEWDDENCYGSHTVTIAEDEMLNDHLPPSSIPLNYSIMSKSIWKDAVTGKPEKAHPSNSRSVDVSFWVDYISHPYWGHYDYALNTWFTENNRSYTQVNVKYFAYIDNPYKKAAIKQFAAGQTVMTKDQDTDHYITGRVLNVTPECITVKWEDLSGPTTHYGQEFDDIIINS